MGRPKNLNPISPVSRAAKKPDLKPIQVQLDPFDLKNLDRIASDLANRDRSFPSRSRAMRWAIRELTQRLISERDAKSEGKDLPAGHGAMSDPPEP